MMPIANFDAMNAQLCWRVEKEREDGRTNDL